VTLGVFLAVLAIHMKRLLKRPYVKHMKRLVSINISLSQPKYETVIAIAHPDLVAHEQNDESLQVEWVAFDDVTKKNLHPSFAKTWPALLAILKVRFV
jgi:hypothetical protein